MRSPPCSRADALSLAPSRHYPSNSAVNKCDILQELPKLTPEERQEIRVRLAELDPDED